MIDTANLNGGSHAKPALQPPAAAMRTPWQVSKAVWYALILRELQSQLWSRKFGGFWMLAEPIAHIVTMMLIFSYLRGNIMPGIPVPLFLLTGLLPFFMMRDIIFGLMGAVNANKALFTYRQVKPADTFVARTAVVVMTNVAIYLLLVFFMAFFLGFTIPVHQPVEMFMTVAVMVAFAVGLGMIFCLLVQAFPDLQSILRMLFMPLYLLSGAIFPLRFIPQPYYDWLLWNPFFNLIDMFRQYSLEGYTPMPGVSLVYPAQCALVLLFVAALVYRRRQYHLVTS